MNFITQAVITLGILAATALGIVHTPAEWYGFEAPNENLGVSLTTLNGTEQLKDFPTTYNANLNALNNGKIEVGTTSVASITTLANLASVGTITSGVWNGTLLTVPFGGTGSSTLSSNQVLLGNGTSLIKTVAGFGTSGQFLTSNGAGTAPSWQTSSINQNDNYTWTGSHDFQGDTKGTQQALFGDGSDGSVTISGNTTLSRDMYYQNLTINSGITLDTANYRIYATGTVNIIGTIDNSGDNGGAGGAGGSGAVSAGAAGTAGATSTIIASGSLPSNAPGRAGGAGGAGAGQGHGGGGGGGGAGASGGIIAIYAKTITIGASGSITSLGGNGGAGGAGGVSGGTGGNGVGPAGVIGGDGFSTTTSMGVAGRAKSGSNGAGGAGSGNQGGSGGATGTAGSVTASKNLPRSAYNAQGLFEVISMTPNKSSASSISGSGGGGGGSSGVERHGGGGGGGGYGGSGGVIILLYETLTNSGSISVAGGSAGTGGAGGVGNEGTGTAGGDGLSGTTGTIYYVKTR